MGTLMHITNLEQYTPEDSLSGILYLKTNNGEDWYQLQSQFQPDTLKVLYNQETKEIFSFSTDVSSLCPLNAGVCELPVGTIVDYRDKIIDGKLVRMDNATFARR